MSIQTPDWVKNAVFYQIFPDRFARSSRIQHPAGIRFKEWGAPPSEQGYQGGDLLGIVDRRSIRTRWINVSAYPQQDASGRLERVVVTFVDVTGHIRAEKLRDAQLDIAESCVIARVRKATLTSMGQW